MTADELRKLFPHASENFIKQNTADGASRSERASPVPVAEPAPSNGPLAACPAQAPDSGKRIVRITSYRVRLLDTDNCIPKWHVDAIRYCGAGILPSDAPDRCEIITTQRKVAHKTEERTHILIERVE